MDSEDSRPGSSASNTSSNSSLNSEQSLQHNDSEYKIGNPQRNANASLESGSSSRNSRLSVSAYEETRNSRSRSKSNSDSNTTLNTSLSEDDDSKSYEMTDAVKERALAFHEGDKANNLKKDFSNPPSVMSKDSCMFSNCSRSNSEERKNTSNLNITHEDLSDVSDLESEKRLAVCQKGKSVVENEESITTSSKDIIVETTSSNTCSKQIECAITDLRQKLEQKKTQFNETSVSPSRNIDHIATVKDKAGESLEDLVKSQDEDALDFEAEEGECQEIGANDGKHVLDKENTKKECSEKLLKTSNDELEEGEVSDEDEKRPEETEPKPVCRFYTRGQCTWGMSCRFLHPGVTDKGNYTMFDLIRPVPLPPGGNIISNRSSNYAIQGVDYHDYRSERPTIHHRNSSLHHNPSLYAQNNESRKVTLDGPVVVESAWERGLRTAKEMMRKANKRKEQDTDFEDKKMNLTLSPDEIEKDAYYLKDRLSPTENPRHALYAETMTDVYSTVDRFVRGPPLAHYDELDPYGRSTRYRELPPHRMPQYEDERRMRPAREVIVQRVEPIGRSDEWNDPWMRSKSPNGRGGSRDRGEKRRRARRSYSSNSSYSSSSSSQTDSSSDSSRSPSPTDRHKRRYNSISHNLSPSMSRRNGRNLRSISPPPRRTRTSPGFRQSPNSKRRADNVLSPIYNRGGTYSPVAKRKKLSPLTKKMRNEKTKSRHSSSSSDTDSTGSDSESDSITSSSESSSQSRDKTPPKRSRMSDKLIANERKGAKKDLPKIRSPITIEIKKPTTVGVSALKSPSQTTSLDKDSKKSRREELLKQLRAVEDAIAKKRSKLS